jgi:ADP-heptose:LPS heptosyltransferase
MGDLIMTGPALNALKKTFNCRITVLTSVMGSLITPYLNCIDDVLVYNLPWIKSDEPITQTQFQKVIEAIKLYEFDGSVIFSVYSQNTLPAAMLTFMANIPKRLAYCRENPYHLLTDWLPDKEPFTHIQHQVKRDLNLVAAIGAEIADDSLLIRFSDQARESALQKLAAAGININKEWIVMHPGVSEEKRKYPIELWTETAHLLAAKFKMPIVLTGSPAEKQLTEEIQQGIGGNAISIAGLLNIEEFIAIIKKTFLVISVNTATVHIAAATKTPVIVLYALTNPQHTPWKVPSIVLPFSVPQELKSNNQIVDYISDKLSSKKIAYPSPNDILEAAQKLKTEPSLSGCTSIINFEK